VVPVFLPCDAMPKRRVAYAIMQCLSVCPYVTFVNSVKMNKHIFTFFSPSGSHATLVFPYRTSWHYSDGYPFNGGIECRWGR